MFWLGKKKTALIQFGTEAADEFSRQVPLDLLEAHLSGKSRKSSRKFEKAQQMAIRRFAEFKAREKPGVYGKAKIHQVFAERLKELGYPPELVDEINRHIITRTP